jgi:ADP-heptose:LPS heptosyltransferase
VEQVLKDNDGVLILRLGAVGDVIRTLPCLARLRESLPGVRIGWVVEPAAARLLPGPPWLDRTFVFPRSSLGLGQVLRKPAEGTRALRMFLSQLRSFEARLTFDFQGTAKSAVLARISGAPMRLGFDRTGSREWSFLLSTFRIRPSSPRLNRVLKNLELLAPLRLPESVLRFPLAPAPRSSVVRAFLAELQGRPRIAVHAGTSDRQAHKRWPAERYGRLVSLMVREGFAPILTWGPREGALARRIQELSSDTGILAPPTDLPEMCELISGCQLFVGNDTGPMHLAWSQGIPVVVLFGSTDPLINGPLGPGHRVLAPAWEDGPPFPVRGDPEPMRLIEPEQVLESVLELLPPRARRGGLVPVP